MGQSNDLKLRKEQLELERNAQENGFHLAQEKLKVERKSKDNELKLGTDKIQAEQITTIVQSLIAAGKTPEEVKAYLTMLRNIND